MPPACPAINPAGATLSLALLLGHLGEGKAAAAVESATACSPVTSE